MLNIISFVSTEQYRSNNCALFLPCGCVALETEYSVRNG